ncbi:hypothetical protein VR45_36095 [Streptomyces sp. NRRL S-495]|nr:hypothetical protein VR45_36095 [Streptomyces sp. NRRL S-495]
MDPGRSSDCYEPVTNRYYEQIGREWGASDSGTVSNGSGASISRAIARTKSATPSATASAEISATAEVFVAGIQAKLGLSVSVSATVTNTETFTVNVPAWTTVSYRDGLVDRRFSVRVVRTCSNCRTSTNWATASAPERYSEVRDALAAPVRGTAPLRPYPAPPPHPPATGDR